MGEGVRQVERTADAGRQSSLLWKWPGQQHPPVRGTREYTVKSREEIN